MGVVLASRPALPVPGGIGSPASSSSSTSGAGMNEALLVGSPLRRIDVPYQAPSLDPQLSTSSTPGRCRNRRSLTSALHTTPAEQIVRRLEPSYGRPSAARASSARVMGLANASPTIASVVTRWRSTASNSWWGSKLWSSSVTIMPPQCRTDDPAYAMAVECMSGAAGTATGREPSSHSRRACSTGSSGTVVGSTS
jgi:hypothetical protein